MFTVRVFIRAPVKTEQALVWFFSMGDIQRSKNLIRKTKND